MPLGHTRVEPVDGIVVEGTLVEGIVVEGTVVDCGTVVVENGEVEGVVEGEMLGVSPTTLLPALELPEAGVEPMAVPSWLCGVPVMLGVGVTAKGDVVWVPGVVAAAPGAPAPAPGAPTWASAGSAARVAASKSGKRSLSSMGNLLCNQG
jgi:pyruvate/2-oxoglutarate dehydrogenase complex dihydrolipoamide acyltransferase (E2) component